MPIWLAFKSQSATGHTSLINGQVFDGASRGDVAVKIKPSGLSDSVQESALSGTKAAYHLLLREGYVVRSILAFHQIEDAPSNVLGESGGLVFALNTANLLLPREYSFSHHSIVATGVIDEKGRITPVEGVEEKLSAALLSLVEGGYFVSTKENISELSEGIREEAKQRNITLVAVNHLADALSAFGVPLRKAYLESPFVGLGAFRQEHSGVFFGRDREIVEATSLLNERGKLSAPRLLVIGVSGVGKSSLVQAGVLSSLTELDSSIQRKIIFQPRKAKLLLEEKGNPLIESIKRLISSKEIGGSDATADVKTIIVIDQLEECFTMKTYSQAMLVEFFGYLTVLSKAGYWLISTLRSDYYPNYQQYGDLVKLFGRDYIYDLLPPDEASIEQIIEAPTEVADFSYELNDRNVSLATKIRLDVGQDFRALPLLSFTLTELYRIRDKRNQQLTYAGYKELNGLKGSIGSSAETAFGLQDTAVKNSLLVLIKKLAIIDTGLDGEKISARTLPYTDFKEGTAIKRLVDTLLEEDYRLLVSEGMGDTAYIRVAHEALLTHWPRAKRLIDQQREYLLQFSQLEKKAKEYDQAPKEEKKGLLLRRGSQLDKAKAFQKQLGADIPELIRKYIKASQKDWRKTLLFAGSSLVFALSISGGYFLWEKNKAVQEEQDITAKEAYKAQIQLAAALIANKDYATARKVLLGVKEYLRQWEWAYYLAVVGPTPKAIKDIVPDEKWFTKSMLDELHNVPSKITDFLGTLSIEERAKEMGSGLLAKRKVDGVDYHYATQHYGARFGIYYKFRNVSAWCGQYGTLSYGIYIPSKDVSIWSCEDNEGDKNLDYIGIDSSQTSEDFSLATPYLSKVNKYVGINLELSSVKGEAPFDYEGFRDKISNIANYDELSGCFSTYISKDKVEEGTFIRKFCISGDEVSVSELDSNISADYDVNIMGDIYISGEKYNLVEDFYGMYIKNKKTKKIFKKILTATELNEADKQEKRVEVLSKDAEHIKEDLVAAYLLKSEGSSERVFGIGSYKDGVVDIGLKNSFNEYVSESFLANSGVSGSIIRLSPSKEQISLRLFGKDYSSLLVWDLSTGELLFEYSIGGYDGENKRLEDKGLYIKDFDWAPDDSFIAVTDRNNHLKIYDGFKYFNLIRDYGRSNHYYRSNGDFGIKNHPHANRYLIGNILIDSNDLSFITKIDPSAIVSKDWLSTYKWVGKISETSNGYEQEIEVTDLGFYPVMKGSVESGELSYVNRLIMNEIKYSPR